MRPESEFPPFQIDPGAFAHMDDDAFEGRHAVRRQFHDENLVASFEQGRFPAALP